MARKHYIKIAEMFRKESRQRNYSDESLDLLHNLASNLADILQEENPHFDRARFMKAVEG